MWLPFDVETRRLDDLHDGAGDVRTDSVARNQRDAMFGHSYSRASQYRSTSAPAMLNIISRVESTCSASKRTRRSSFAGRREGSPPASACTASIWRRTTKPE